MARDTRGPREAEIPWWGYLIVVLAIILVILVGVWVWHLIAVVRMAPRSIV